MNKLLASSGRLVAAAIVSGALVAPLDAVAAKYSCLVTRKFDRDREYSKEQIERGQFSNVIVEDNDGASVSRCSFAPSANRVTCDEYKMDRVVLDANVGIKKYYLFRAQFDVQLYADLSFVENTGRGGISFGSCKLVSP